MEKIRLENDVIVYYCADIIKGKYYLYDISGSMMVLDSSNNLLPDTSFTWINNDYKINYDLVNSIPKDSSYENFESFLLINYDWTLNFAHVLNETLPKLMLYKEIYKNNSNLKLLIHEGYDKEYWYDIFDLLNIKKDDIIILKHSSCYPIKNLYICKMIVGFENPTDPIKISFFSEIRKNLIPLMKSPDFKKISYILRNDNNIVNRTILNESEIIENLSQFFKKDFNIVDKFASKNLKQKAESLSNTEIIISPIGANLMNLVFANSPKYLIILCSPTWDSTYFGDLINHLGGDKTKVIYIKGKNEGENRGPSTNYTIDINILLNTIKSLTS